MTTPAPTTPAPLTPTEKLGQDFSKVYNSGEVIIRAPIEVSTIYLITAILAATIEYLFEMAGRVNSKFFHQLFDVQTEESLVFGILILLLIFVTSLISEMPEQWAVVFAWTEMSLVFMMIWFVGILSAVALMTGKLSKELEVFETTRMGGGDSSEKIKDYEKVFAKATTRFKMSMMTFGYDKPLVCAKYIFRVQKKLICGLGDLNWKVWLSMSLPTLFNAVRAGAMDGAEDTGNATVALFIFWQGGMPLVLFLFIYFKLKSRIREYVETNHEQLAFRVKALDANYADTADADVEPFSREELVDPKRYLIWSSLDNTLNVVQISLIQFTWYGAILVVTMFSKIMAQNGGVAFVLFVGSLMPPVIFVVLMPWTVTIISILTSMETELSDDFVQASYARLEKDGLAKLLVVTNQAAEEEKKKQEFSVNNTAAIQDALDAKLAAEAAKARKDALVDEEGRPIAKRLAARPLEMGDVAMQRMNITRSLARREREDD